ncbi:MAG TPA: lipocalin-like domain-containing protein [Anaerolineales bacterium]
MIRRSRLFWILLAMGVLALAGLFLARSAGDDTELAAQVRATPRSIEGFTRASGPQPFDFPTDFGPHPDYRTEWWYYIGNLDTADGRHFGFELTFFRVALLPANLAAPRASDWAANQIYMAHFALTDVSGGQFHAFQRFARGALGLAGAQASPFRVWLEDWQVAQAGEGIYLLKAANEGLALELRLIDRKGPVPHGEEGYSQKGPDPGNASYYYSQTRLQVEGDIYIGDETFAVSGLSWSDHEYSTSVLSAGQVGWDWFAIQLDDGSEVMLYAVRRADGSIDPFSSGTLIEADGSTQTLGLEDFAIETLDLWRSPHTDAEYPSGWKLTIPSAGLQLELSPYLLDQELKLSTIYWEGAVEISGTQHGQPVSGVGYVELTGYAEPFNGDF